MLRFPASSLGGCRWLPRAVQPIKALAVRRPSAPPRPEGRLSSLERARWFPRLRLAPFLLLAQVSLTSGSSQRPLRSATSTAMAAPSLPPDKPSTSLRVAPPGTVNLAVGHPSPRLLPEEAMQRACGATADRLGAGQINLSYGRPQGQAAFLEHLGAFLSSEYGSTVPPDTLLTTNGISHSLDLVAATFTSPGDLVIVETPTYFLASRIFEDHYLELLSVPADKDGMRLDLLEAKLEAGLVPRMVYLVPTNSNPSGCTMSTERRHRLMALAHQHGFLIVADEVYHLLDWGMRDIPRFAELEKAYNTNSAGPNFDGDETCYESATPVRESSPKKAKGALSLGSFTKILSPGVRLGWVEGPPHLLEPLTERGYIVSGGGVAPFASEIVTEVIKSGNQKVHLDLLRKVYRERCTRLCDELEASEVGFELMDRPVGGYFVWVKLPANITAKQLLPAANDHLVKFLPGDRCCPREEEHADRIRLCFAFLETEEIVDGVKKLTAAVKQVLSEAVR